MHRPRNLGTAVALLALALPTVAGCSSGPATTTSKVSVPASTTPTSAPATTDPTLLPATGSVDGFTLSVTSSPTSGTVGHTTIRVTAVLKGAVRSAHLQFQVSDAAAAGTGRPATDQRLVVHGPGTYALPTPFAPPSAGSWAVTVTYVPDRAGASRLSVSGLPPAPGQAPPFPQLVTKVTA